MSVVMRDAVKALKLKLGPSARAVLYRLADYYNDNVALAWPSVHTLARETELSERTVQRALHQCLEPAGLVRAEAYRRGGHARATRWSLHFGVLDGVPSDAFQKGDTDRLRVTACPNYGDTVTPEPVVEPLLATATLRVSASHEPRTAAEDSKTTRTTKAGKVLHRGAEAVARCLYAESLQSWKALTNALRLREISIASEMLMTSDPPTSVDEVKRFYEWWLDQQLPSRPERHLDMRVYEQHRAQFLSAMGHRAERYDEPVVVVPRAAPPPLEHVEPEPWHMDDVAPQAVVVTATTWEPPRTEDDQADAAAVTAAATGTQKTVPSRQWSDDEVKLLATLNERLAQYRR